MIKKISCRVVRSITFGKSGSGQRAGRFNNKRSKAGDVIAGDSVSRSSGSCVGSVKSRRLALGLLSYTRQLDIKVAFDSASTGRVLDYYA
jgi:hypothetical protein